MEKEIWMDIAGFEGLYEVSNKGNIRSIRNGGELLKGSVDKGGYRDVMLYDHSKYKHIKVHRAVALAFLENPENKRTVNHIDGNKLNNHVENLEWATHGENHKHAYSIGLKSFTERQREACSKTGKETVDKNRPRRPVIMISESGEEKRFESAHEGARYVCGDASAIVACCKGKIKTSKGYRWIYANQ